MEQTIEQKETKNSKKAVGTEPKPEQVLSFKRASELTDAERTALQHVKVQITKSLSSKKKIIFSIRVKFTDNLDKDKNVVVDYLTFGKFSENMYEVMCLENGLNPQYNPHVLNVPVRLFTGFTTDRLTGESRPYTRYQLLLSKSVTIGAFFKFHELKLIELKAPEMKFIKVDHDIDFSSDAAEGF